MPNMSGPRYLFWNLAIQSPSNHDEFRMIVQCNTGLIKWDCMEFWVGRITD